MSRYRGGGDLVGVAIALVVIICVLQYIAELVSRYAGLILLAVALFLIGTFVYRRAKRL
jgi:hypothetical protein